jgi:hypothetical protein
MLQFDEKLFASALAEGLRQGLGQKGPVGTMTTNWPHGAGGFFGVCGLEEGVISARLTPRGISRVLPIVPTVDTAPVFPYITGIEESGSEPDAPCDQCISGVTESCMQTAQFGRICRESKELDPNRAIERLNRGEFDLRLVNDLLGMAEPFLPSGLSNPQILQLATQLALLEVGALLQQKLSPMIWQGNPANSVGTGYMEFPGFDMLIATGKQDALTGTLCPALDPDIKDFACDPVCGNARDIVEYMSMMDAYLEHNADRMGLNPVDSVWVMRPELWYVLSECWPCSYFTYRCATRETAKIDPVPGLDAASMTNIRDQMRRGMFIMVNGREMPVVTDDGIFEQSSGIGSCNLLPGQFASDIYRIPLTVTGSGGRMMATYLQHKDYRATVREVAGVGNLSQSFWVTDEGRFHWTVDKISWCFVVKGKIEPRVILRVPQLSGRIQNVMYEPLQHFRTPFQDSDYFVKGGVPERSAPEYYSEWNPRGVQ